MTQALSVLDSVETDRIKIEVVAYPRLKGSDSLGVAEKVFLLNEAQITTKMLRITLDDHKALIEPGALYFMKGALTLESKMQGGLVSGVMRRLASGETMFQSSISGSGEVYLEPTFGHYLLMNVDDERIICDKGAFIAASGGISVKAEMQRSVSSALFGGEGLFQTAIEGHGVVALKSPVPVEELMIITLDKGEKLTVDGNFALARTASVDFRAEKSGGSLFQSVTSGELLLQTFTGPGTVFLAPTEPVYQRIGLYGGVEQLVQSNGSSNNRG
ncbi:AIM24 family protein [Pseudomonas sp. LRF_L74]|uniref:AIM24 family protein n=1 Tax=Pseudomonas sp. LRF_L74 TaxID=3369422 RepID=UPI003F624E70